MSKKAARLWQQLLDQLPIIAKDSTVVGTSAAYTLEHLLQQLAALPPQPQTVWKALIQEFQLPRQLGSLACLITSGDPYRAGGILPATLVSTMHALLVLLPQAGISSGGQYKALWGSAQQQFLDSGFITTLKHLMEATAEQLVRCTTAAAVAAAGDSDTSPTAAAAAAASLQSPAPTCSDFSVRVLNMLQCTASKLLEAHIRLYIMFSGAAAAHGTAAAHGAAQDMVGSLNAAATHLMVAGMRHVSVMLPTVPQRRQREQQQQQDLPKGLIDLAFGVSSSTLAAANFFCGFYKHLPQTLLGRGPDFVVWSDLSLLQLSYCCSLQQQLPAAAAIGGNRGTAAAAAAAAAAAPRRAASSSSSSSRQQQRGREQPQPATGGLAHVLRKDLALAAWQEVQENCDHVPASHKPLLQLLGVSPQAALWLATLMLKGGLPIPTVHKCWDWNPHNVATAAEDPAQLSVEQARAAAAVVVEYQQQLQQWDDTPVRELLQLLLLYEVAHSPADTGHDEFICCCIEVLTPLLQLLHQQQQQQQLSLAAGVMKEQGGSAGSRSGHTPAFTLTMQWEALCLVVRLMQRLQLLRGASAASSSSSNSATHRTFANAADRAERINHSEELGMGILLLLFVSIKRVKTQQWLEASQAPAETTAAAAAGAAAAGERCHTSSDAMPAAVPQQAGALFGVVETYLRRHSASPLAVLDNAARIAASCCMGDAHQPNLLLGLAQGATGEQQVAFFNLLVTLLKLSATPAYLAAAGTGNPCNFAPANAAVRMLLFLRPNSQGVKPAAAAAADGSSSASSTSSTSSSVNPQGGSSGLMSAALWLLLLGRLCLQWGCQLAQLQAKGAAWAQLIRQTQQQCLEAVADETPCAPTSVMSLCFASYCPQLLSITECVLAVLREGSSSSAGLTAAGYDLGAVLHGFEALSVCYPGVLEAEGPGDVVASRVAGLIKALEAVGRTCSVFAVPHCCNNPGCSNLAGPTEVCLVSGKSCICGGCQVARYCGKGCQQPHWKQHKAVCKMLQAANAQLS